MDAAFSNFAKQYGANDEIDKELAQMQNEVFQEEALKVKVNMNEVPTNQIQQP